MATKLTATRQSSVVSCGHNNGWKQHHSTFPGFLPLGQTGELVRSSLGDLRQTPSVSKAAPSTSYVSQKDTG